MKLKVIIFGNGKKFIIELNNNDLIRFDFLQLLINLLDISTLSKKRKKILNELKAE